MLRNTLMSTSDTIVLFDVGAGQVAAPSCPSERYQADHEVQVQGSRKSQEDRHTIILPEHFPAKTDDNLAFFAIYDGQ